MGKCKHGNEVYPICKECHNETTGNKSTFSVLLAKLAKYQEQYIELLEDENKELAVQSASRGWASTRVESGKQARKQIAKLKQLLG